MTLGSCGIVVSSNPIDSAKTLFAMSLKGAEMLKLATDIEQDLLYSRSE